ncbi:MAG TPA: trimethylamine methyltransferase family protein [Gaiella sp.]|uniref:trimethylamine methyltransferase family protein n=1 Tax=Gaiella sp. TaxID=2663207 RepID=UPI002D7FA83C|nr:trimethylamine methyltransferase family protein [Gaiella sp.]HET9286964.1 trimethylamine methyltransferase family protein [Gaiella sp.]
MTETRGRRSGGRAARQAARLHAHVEHVPFLVRALQPLEVLSEEGLSLLEQNADRILEEVGIEFHDAPDALELFAAAGASVEGERVRFPRGLCRSLVQATAPTQFTQVARNRANDVVFGGQGTIFAPAYGSPFVRDLDGGRRYGTIEDFRNFVKLAYTSPWLHHSGGTVCEPVDVPVNKRHFDMIYAHLRCSDKPFMGSVTRPERARDTVEMARIVFGREFVDANTVVFSLINANSPLVWDATMLGAARAYAEANQAVMMTPFILAGAMSPATVAATCAQTLAESLAGMAYVQLVRTGAPVVLGSFASSMSMQSGAPTFGTPEPALVLYVMAALARRLGVPFRSGGALTASKVADAQAAYESANTMQPTMLAGVNFVLHAAGWLEGGLSMGYEKFVLDADQLGMWHAFAPGVDLSENGQAMDAFLTNEPGTHFLGHPHTLANFEQAFYRSSVADNSSFEQWESEGARDAATRANATWKSMLAEYQAPPIDEAVDEELREWIDRRKASFPDASE